MKALKIFQPLFCGFLLLGCFSCQVPSTEELDKEISKIEKEIISVNNESEKYSGGLIKALIDIRKETFKNTKTILEQKKLGIKRFIPVTYTIDGEKYSPPDNKMELINDIQMDIEKLERGAEKIQKKSNKYTGGLIKVMLQMELATVENNVAFLEQRKLLLKHDIPLYTVMPKLDNKKSDKEFKPTQGKDISKF